MCCRKLLTRELEGALSIVVGSDQKPDLNGGDYDQSRTEQRQPKCVYGDTVVGARIGLEQYLLQLMAVIKEARCDASDSRAYPDKANPASRQRTFSHGMLE